MVVGLVTYVVAHGWYESGEPDVVVPRGMTLSFLADVDLNAVHHIQVAQLLVGGVSAATTYHGDDPLPNYRFSQFEDDKVARLLALNLHDLDLWVVGPVPAFSLCADPGGACSADAHGCEGLLGLAQRQGIDHLHFLTCRVDNAPGHEPWAADYELHEDASGSDPTWHDELVGWTTSFAALDFDAQRTVWESLEYEDQVVRTADAEVAEWAEIFEAVKAHEAGEATFLPYLASLSGTVRERLLREHPEIADTVRASLGPETIAECAAYAQWFLSLPFDQQTLEWDQQEPAVRETLLLDPGVGDWALARSARDYLDYFSPEQFRAYCQKLPVGARTELLADPRALQLYQA